MRPGSSPIESLAHALEDAGVRTSSTDDESLRVGLTHATLDSGERGLVEAAQQAQLDTDENVLVVVDQFEELFRFRHSRSAAHASDEAAAFVKLILTAAASDDVPIYVMITMRSDFIGECARFSDLPETLNDGLFLVPRLTRDQLREAIEGPVGVAGASIAPRLVNRLLNDLGDDPARLPVLQHALMRTWDLWEEEHRADEPLDLPEYLATGGLDEALSIHGDEILRDLPNDHLRAIAEHVFKALTESGGKALTEDGTDTMGVRRPATFATLCAIAAADPNEVRVVIDAFRAPKASFLMPPLGEPLEPQTVVDLSHEALMRTWLRLRGWVADEAEAANLYRRLLNDSLKKPGHCLSIACWRARKSGTMAPIQRPRGRRATVAASRAWNG
jgi:hypothetical protein